MSFKCMCRKGSNGSLICTQSAGDSTDAQTSCIREQVTQWLKCGHPRLRSDATVVCNAILKDKILSRRICRYIDRQAAESHSHTRAPETCGIVTYKDDTPGHVNLGPALVKLRDVMVHKNALRKLLAHFGGSRPHAGARPMHSCTLSPHTTPHPAPRLACISDHTLR